MEHLPDLVPLLVVRGAAEAIDFYATALGARELRRFAHGPERHISHAELAIGDGVVALTEEVPAFNSDAPPSLGGSPVVMQVEVTAVDEVVATMRKAGAEIVFDVVQLLGERMARVRDPFGHLWLLHQRIEVRSDEELQRERDAIVEGAKAAARKLSPRVVARPLARQGRGEVHLVVGPVGAGKSTYATSLASERRALRLTLDAWMVRLFSSDRPVEGVVPWYVERAERCVDQIWETARAVAELGMDVVLEVGLVRRNERERFYALVDASALELTIHVLDAVREVRRRRVEERNRARGATFSMVVPPEIFELASDLYEPVEDVETRERRTRRVRTDSEPASSQ